MAINLNELMDYLNVILQPEKFQDYCPNGLQIEGRNSIKKIVSGVSACQYLLDKAVAENADAILVHHGYFWKDEYPAIIGIKRKRIATLINNDISLLAYHLPLDAHPIYGNNAELAKLLNFEIIDRDESLGVDNLILLGKLKKSLLPHEFIKVISEKFNRKAFYIPGNSEKITRIAWCSGGAQSFIEQAAKLNVDAYLTGEVSEKTVHLARELGLHFISAGHHATERYGVQALGEHLAEKFNIEHKYVEIDNPV